jgi:PAS domain S-box-containing protein
MDLSRSQSFIKQVFEHSPLATVVMDPVTYRYIDCNQAALRLCGVSAKDAFLGKTPMDFSAPCQYDGRRSSEAAVSYIDMAIAEGYARFEWRHQRPDGAKWDGEVHLRPFEADGMPLLQFSLVDITERKALEKTQSILHGLIMELNSCVDLGSGLKAVLDSALRFECLDSGGIYITNQADATLRLAAHSGFSPEFAALTGSFPADSPQARRAARGEALYGEYESLLSATDPIRKQEGLRAFAMIPIMAGGSLVAVLNLASHAHGAMPEYVKKALELIAYQAGGILLRLRADAALRASDEVLRRFLANSPIFAFIKSVSPTESRFLLASDTFKDFLGLSGKEIAGASTAELFPKELADKTIAEEWETVSTRMATSADSTPSSPSPSSRRTGPCWRATSWTSPTASGRKRNSGTKSDSWRSCWMASPSSSISSTRTCA